MDAPSSKQLAITFFEAHYAGNVSAASACCAPNFQSIVYAPVDLFPHLGLQRGKEWIAQSIRTQNERFTARRYDVLSAIGEDNNVALFGTIHLTKRKDGRVIEFVSE